MNFCWRHSWVSFCSHLKDEDKKSLTIIFWQCSKCFKFKIKFLDLD